jgi:enoyl-CoA hydratase
MPYQNILTQTEGDVQVITINREDKLNALNRITLEELVHAVESAGKNRSVTGIIITGAGKKAFVAGADIAEFSDYDPGQGSEMALFGQSVFNQIENCSKPVIAAVNGFALGGGCELAMACHMRIASDNAKFGQPEVKLGIIPGYGGTQRMTHLIGKGRAFEFMITSRMMNAEEAFRIGMVNHVTSQDELMNKCFEIMAAIRDQSPMAIAAVIRCVNASFTEGMDGFTEEIREFGNCFGTPDYTEGTSAFLEKRKPVFR